MTERNNNITTRIILENITILLLALLGVLLFISGFFPSSKISGLVSCIFEIKKMAARFFAVALIITTFHLFLRKQVAWIIAIGLVLTNLIHHILHPFPPTSTIIMALEILILLVFFCCAGDFCCPSKQSSLKQGAIFFLISIAGILINTGIGYHFLKIKLNEESSSLLFTDSLRESLRIMFGGTNNNAPGFPTVWTEGFMFWFSWICILIALIYILQPWIKHYLWSESAVERARALVLKYGQNPSSYLTLEDDKLLYFGKTVEGVIAYGVVGNTIIVNGDPICAPEDFSALLQEFRQYCQKSAHKLFFLTVTGKYIEKYKNEGFGTVKCGEEAIFNLQEYNITGKKGAKMRMNINHATKAGLTVKEYNVLEKRDYYIEREFYRITEEWLAEKKTSMLRFSIGSIGLERPMDRRYFYASDETGKIMGFIVFCPFACRKGYMADITRRTNDAPSGIMEKIMYEAFIQFKEEGIQYASLGLAPLANLMQKGEDGNGMEKLLHFVYEHLNGCYGFKNLYKTKERYNPTTWEAGYYAFFPKIPTPQMLYAIVQIHNQQGILDFIKPVIQNFFHEKRKISSVNLENKQ